MSTRPVAVLLGWLGCQPKNLRRFVNLYNDKGWDSIVRVASPESVIAAIQQGPSNEQVRPQTNLSSQCGHLQPSNLTKEMCLQAFDILHELESRQCSQFIVHIFSNGGCFLWEWMAHILMQQHRKILCNNSTIDVQKLRNRLAGCVFDSSPANYEGRPDGIVSALQHVTPIAEKNRLLEIAGKVDTSTVNARHDKFWDKLCNDHCFGVPELYMYSENDQLTLHKPLQKLITRRHDLLGKGNVWVNNFVDSEHCAHLLKYPEQYDSVLGQFIASCSSRNFITSKL